jgi:hypothetical protein
MIVPKKVPTEASFSFFQLVGPAQPALTVLPVARKTWRQSLNYRLFLEDAGREHPLERE